MIALLIVLVFADLLAGATAAVLLVVSGFTEVHPPDWLLWLVIAFFFLDRAADTGEWIGRTLDRLDAEDRG